MDESALSDTDDLHRDRRRVRVRRLLAGGGVALVAASVIAAVWLFSEPNRLQPSDPPEPTTQLVAPQSPLVAPESPLEVRELGFHVESAKGVAQNQDWSLAPTYQATTVESAGQTLSVRVYYEGTGYPDLQLNAADGGRHVVSVHGVPGAYFEQFGKAVGDGIDFRAGACGTPPLGCDFWQSQLIWEYAPGSWASVYGDTGESPAPQAAIRPAFLKVAELVRSGGGVTTRVPFRVGPGLSPLPPITEAGVGMTPFDYPRGTSGWLVSFYGEPTLQFSADGVLCSTNEEDPDSTVQRFTYRGHKGCLHLYQGELSGVSLRVDGVDRGISNLFGNESKQDAADLKQWLADLTVAPLDDPSTWFDLKSAFRH